jgi:DNA-directed RNA polymerase specialized sigma24 family protein
VRETGLCMGLREAHDPKVLVHYEGLIFVVAQTLIGKGVEMEMEDVQQILRIKTYRSLERFQVERIRRRDESAAEARDRYIRMVLIDQGKDLLKRRRRGELHIEDLVATSPQADSGGLESRDWFDEKYLSSSHDDVYREVEAESFDLPATLTPLERRLVLFLYRDYKQSEAGRLLGLDKREIERAMRSIRLKLADWKPDSEPTPLPLLPSHDEAPPPSALAA